METVSKGIVNDFIRQHPHVKAALLRWYLTTSTRSWANPSELKETFNSVDYVGNGLYVFNIKGNDYRLIAFINFKTQLVVIRFIGTHAEYDRVRLNDLVYEEPSSG